MTLRLAIILHLTFATAWLALAIWTWIDDRRLRRMRDDLLAERRHDTWVSRR